MKQRLRRRDHDQQATHERSGLVVVDDGARYTESIRSRTLALDHTNGR